MFDHAVDEAIHWIETVETNRHEGFFLFLHTYELHHPYTPKPEDLASIGAEYDGSLAKHISVDLLMRINDGDVEIETGDLEHIISTYDAELRSVDTAFGRLIDFLHEEELYDDAIIVFTSDHGEEFGERGFVGWHSHTLYDELCVCLSSSSFPVRRTRERASTSRCAVSTSHPRFSRHSASTLRLGSKA